MDPQESSSENGLTVLIAVYNEAERIASVSSRVVRVCRRLTHPFRVLILDDGSTDWSESLEERILAQPEVSVRHLTPNRGKGAVLNDAFPEVATPWTVVIDGDDEYAPEDIPAVLGPLVEGRADWVLGSRYRFGRSRPRQYFATYQTNRIASALFSALSGVRVEDLLTGLYGFTTRSVAGVRLDRRRFAYTPELLWKSRRIHRARFMEVPVSYRFRTYGEGKKIRWWEAFTVVGAILEYRFSPPT